MLLRMNGALHKRQKYVEHRSVPQALPSCDSWYFVDRTFRNTKTINESHETRKDTAETRRHCRGADSLIRIER